MFTHTLAHLLTIESLQSFPVYLLKDSRWRNARKTGFAGGLLRVFTRVRRPSKKHSKIFKKHTVFFEKHSMKFQKQTVFF
jgi:hypothetical protein